MVSLSNTKLQIGWKSGRVLFPNHTATFVVKGTYDLKAGDRCVLSGEQQDLQDDVFENGSEAECLRYSTDFADYKPNADLLLVGHAHGKRAQVLPVQFSVGSFSKELLVFGDRFWERERYNYRISSPIPFDRIPLTYCNSFGGPTFPHNPLGKGFEDSLTQDGNKVRFLPNIESPADLIRDRNGRPAPACFAPIPLTWPRRISKAGTYNKKWLKERWPSFPADFDWSFFNAAPEDQQLPGFLRGDETIRLQNLRVENPDYTGSLPGIRVRCFYAEVIGAPIRFEEVPMRLDTLWLDADSGKVILVWRGVVKISNEDLGESDQLLVVSEPLDGELQPLAFYNRIRYELASSSEDGPLSEIPNETDELEEFEFEQLASERSTAEEEEQPVTADWCHARLRGGEGLAGQDLSNVDLSRQNLSRVDFRDAILTNASFRGADLSGANFSGAALSGADFSNARLTGACLANGDLAGALLVKADLREAFLHAADFSKADLSRANLARACGSGTIFSAARLLKADCTGARFPQADFSASQLHGADFTDACLTEASFEKALAFPLIADRANLSAAKLAEAALWGSRFRGTTGPDSIWQGADLRDCDFTGACLNGAEFEESSLPRANFTGAVLKRARLVRARLRKANLHQADFLKASLEKADLTEANLSGANFYAADMRETVLEGAAVAGTNFKRTLVEILAL